MPFIVDAHPRRLWHPKPGRAWNRRVHFIVPTRAPGVTPALRGATASFCLSRHLFADREYPRQLPSET